MKNKTGKILAISAIIGGSILTLFVGFLILIIVFGSDEESTEPKEAETKETIVKEDEPKKETAPKEEKKEEVKEEVKEESTPTEEPAPIESNTNNFTLETLTNTINERYKEAGSDKIVSFRQDTEDPNLYSFFLSTNSAIIAKLNDSGIVEEVNVLHMLEDSDELDSMEFLIGMAVMIGVFNPEIPMAERGGLLDSELQLTEILSKETAVHKATIGTVYYQLTISKSIGGIQMTVFPSGKEVF